jgi:sugar phosphate isomerase/epimerase
MLTVAGGGVAMAVGAGVRGVTASAATVAPASQDIKLGVASYSLRNFQRPMAISMLKQLGVNLVSVKEFHIPYTVTPEEAAKAKADFEKAGITIVSGGVITLDDKDPKGLRTYFEYARRCGMPMIIAAPTHPALSEVEKLAREFDIKVAIHNHGPEDKHFPTPQSVLEAVKNMDSRLGLCIDLGHSMRTGANVVQSIADAGPRLLDMHIKDLKSATDKASQCDVGQGVMPIVGIFKQLKKMQYAGTVNLEYEINGENPLPGMASSFAYMRGVLAGLAG